MLPLWRKFTQSLTDVMIFKNIFTQKLAKMVHLTRNKAKLRKHFDHNIGF
jgi:hypothetical protein